jgi:hypothetical protein
MARFFAYLIIGLIVLSGGASASGIPDRFAFVIGNGAYERDAGGNKLKSSTFNLETPENDARAYIDILGKQGWQILNKLNVNVQAARMLDDLKAAASQITEGSEVVFVYTGHGFTELGENYLVGIPDDHKIYPRFSDMRAGSISLNTIVRVLAQSRPARIVLIINACSDEPLLEDVSIAPERPEFDAGVAEVLVLYSSSPDGIAYDVLDTVDKQTSGVLSVFSRSFTKLLSEDRPLLSIFADARIEVEGLSRRPAKAKGDERRAALQIPHVLYDTIDGRFNMANPAATLDDRTQTDDWRVDPFVCRVREEALAEALGLRANQTWENGVEQSAVQACIVSAAYADLGIDSLSYDGAREGVVVARVGADSKLATGDLIARINVKCDGKNTERERLETMDQFLSLLNTYYFSSGCLVSLYHQSVGTTNWTFEHIKF